MIKLLFYIIYVSLALCEFGIQPPSNILDSQFYDSKLLGTWVIYDGGSIAPDVLQFDVGGVGTAFDLPKDYDEIWFEGGALDESLLTQGDSFYWELELINEEEGTLQIEFQNTSYIMETRHYQILFVDNMDDTLLPGFQLSLWESGGGWLKVSVVDQEE